MQKWEKNIKDNIWSHNVSSASYTSFLSVVTQAQPFATIAELEQETSYTVGAQEGTAFRNMFIVSEVSLIRYI